MSHPNATIRTVRQTVSPDPSETPPHEKSRLARDNGIVVGCVALVPAGNGVFVLSKMTVSPSRRGKGLGRAIVLAAIRKAREMRASTLFLGSSTKLANAVRLCESVGFHHVPLDELGPLPYRRADVFMKYQL